MMQGPCHLLSEDAGAPQKSMIAQWHTVQGGSDISGTLSKLHRSIIKSYFSLILSRQTVSPVCRIINKTNRHILAKINQQEATRAETVFGLRAGRTSKEVSITIYSYGDFRKNTFLR